ncbi:MAG: hypothetical protein JKY04_04870 [Sneathiella sp.]|nr:hypothetical protein [Sneathiella sp.]
MTADNGNYIIEFLKVGNSVKVSAFDPATLTEVSIIGPVKAARHDLQRTVLQKLHYVLAKNEREKSKVTQREPDKKGGIIV